MVPTDAGDVKMGHVLSTKGEGVAKESKGRTRRVDIESAPHELFKDIVLRRTPKFIQRDTALFGQGGIHGDNHGSGSVDSKIRGDFVKLNIPGIRFVYYLKVPQRVDGYPHASHLALRPGIVGVVSALCGKVHGHVWSAFSSHGVHANQVVPVVLRGAESGVLPSTAIPPFMPCGSLG